MIKTLQRRFALSRQGAVDLIKGCIACVVQDISFMLPVGLLYYFVIDTMNGNLNGSRIAFYAVGSLVCLCLIFIATWFQYNATYLATYVESGVRRISLAERLLWETVLRLKLHSPIMYPHWQAPSFQQH